MSAYRGTLRALTPAADTTTAPNSLPYVSGAFRNGSGAVAPPAAGSGGSVAAAFEIPSDGDDSTMSDDSSRAISGVGPDSALGIGVTNASPPPAVLLPSPSTYVSFSSVSGGADGSSNGSAPPPFVGRFANTAASSSFGSLATAAASHGNAVAVGRPPMHAFHTSMPMYVAGQRPYIAMPPGTPPSPSSASTAAVVSSASPVVLGEGGSRSIGGTMEVAQLSRPVEYLPLMPMPGAAPKVNASPPSFLVLGTPHCGISTFINAYRASLAHTDEWPSAPTGICGLYGTTAVDAYPNLTSRPSWYLLDTPGMVLDDLEADDSRGTLWLQYLFDGIPMKTKLVGPNARSLAELSQLAGTCGTAHRPQQCIVVVSAVELIEDVGARRSWLEWMSRYIPGPNAGRMIRYLQLLILRIRVFLDDLVPFVVVTHMDQFGGTENSKARDVLLRCLTQCISVERVFFVGCPPSATNAARPAGTSGKKYHDVDGVREMRKLHRELMQSVKMTRSA